MKYLFIFIYVCLNHNQVFSQNTELPVPQRPLEVVSKPDLQITSFELLKLQHIRITDNLGNPPPGRWVLIKVSVVIKNAGGLRSDSCKMGAEFRDGYFGPTWSIPGNTRFDINSINPGQSITQVGIFYVERFKFEKGPISFRLIVNAGPPIDPYPYPKPIPFPKPSPYPKPSPFPYPRPYLAIQESNLNNNESESITLDLSQVQN